MTSESYALAECIAHGADVTTLADRIEELAKAIVKKATPAMEPVLASECSVCDVHLTVNEARNNGGMCDGCAGYKR